jgi:hypothetical protein
VAAVARGDATLEIFWIDQVGAVNQAIYDANWSYYNTKMIKPAGTVSSSAKITVVSKNPGSWDAFYISQDGYVQWTSWDINMGLDVGGGSGPSPLVSANNAAADGGISAVSPQPSLVQVFYVGTDNSIQCENLFWGPPAPDQHQAGTEHMAVTGPGTVYSGSSVAAVTRSPNVVDVFYIDNNSQLSAIVYSNGTSSNPYTFPAAAPSAGIAVVSRDPGGLVDIFYETPAGALSNLSWREGDHGWVGGPITGDGVMRPDTDISVVSRAPNTMEVFFNGPANSDGQSIVQDVYYYFGNRPQWSSPVTPADSPYSLGKGVSAVSRTATTADVFYNDANFYLLQNQYMDWGAANAVWKTRQLPGTVQTEWPEAAKNYWPQCCDVPINECCTYPVTNGAFLPIHDDPINYAPQWVAGQYGNTTGKASDLEGVAHFKGNWYITTTQTEYSNFSKGDLAPRLYKIPLDANFTTYNPPVPYFFPFLTDGQTYFREHYGDLDAVGKYLFIPVEHNVKASPDTRGPVYLGVVYDTAPNDPNSTYYVVNYGQYLTELGAPTRGWPSGIPVVQNAFPWLAVNPRDGRLYSSADPGGLYSYQVHMPSPTDSGVYLTGPVVYTPFQGGQLKILQGGVFSPNGHLYLVSQDTTFAWLLDEGLTFFTNDQYGGIFGIDVIAYNDSNYAASGTIHPMIANGQFPYLANTCGTPFDYDCGDEPEGIDYLNPGAKLGAVVGSVQPYYPGVLHALINNNAGSAMSFYHFGWPTSNIFGSTSDL